MKTIMVLDGNSIMNRAFYGVRMLTTGDGTPTNGVYGFLNILQKLINDENPDGLCVTFDMRAPTFRHEQYAEYKAQRHAMPEELAAQMPIIKEVLDAMRIPRYELEGWEADDLIGTIAARCEDSGVWCVIVTGDKDSFQLVSDTTRVKHIKTRMGQTETKEYDVEAFFEEYGFPPLEMIDFKALMGDPSDNIPGVAGIGEKTASALIRQFGGIDSIYENLETLDVKDSVRKKLDTGHDSAKLSYELATIHRDAPIAFITEDTMRHPVDNDALFALFQKLEFAKLTERFGLIPPEDYNASPQMFEGECVSVEVITPEDISGMEKSFRSVDFVAVRHNRDFSTIVAECGGTAYILRSGESVYHEAAQILFGEAVKKLGHDIKDTMRGLLERGIASGGWIFDCALAAYLLDPTGSGYAIDNLCRRYCGFTPNSGADVQEQLSFLDESVSELAQLLSEAAALRILYETFAPKLTELGMDKLYYDIELPLCEVLAEMEKNGILVDRQALSAFGDALSIGINDLEKSIYELTGENFNINSTKQLGEVLFNKLMLPAPKKTKTGYSTDIEVLEKLRGKHPVIELLVDYRELTKLKSTYADGLTKVIAPDGRIHTKFQMTVTATGRLSSTEPNLQNIPVRRELGGEIRKMFVAAPGHVLVDADYSQIELRLLAHISDDDTMKNAFTDGEDIHAVTASQVFDTPLSEVTSLQRSRAKAVNFGIVYGISSFSLAQDIGVSVAEAKSYMDNYLAKYSGVRQYMSDIVEKAKADGYVATLFGRRRYLPELKSSNFNIRSFGERVALNMPIQGTAADVMKLAMINVSRRIKDEGLSARLLLQIHDELIVECPENEAEYVARLLKEAMEQVAEFSVPLTAEAHIGKSWAEAK